MGQMTVARAKSIKTPGRHRAGDTLYLLVQQNRNGTVRKSWMQRLVIHGRSYEIGLGSFKFVTLAEARDKAYENRKLARHGGDPMAEKRKGKVPTFQEAVTEKYADLLPTWKNERTGQSWLAVLDKYAMPHLGNMRVDQIERTNVLNVLAPVWHTKPATAKRLRRYIKTVFGWAQAHGFVEINPAGEAIDGALTKKNTLQTMNRPALPYQEVPKAIEAIRKTKTSQAVRACLEFVILTAPRSGEARGARWDEIDLEHRLWTVPAKRMKSGREHRQPLSDAALAVLETMHALRDDSGLVFPSPKTSRPLDDKTLCNVLKSIGLEGRATVHGFRASFRSWAGDNTNADNAVMEICLAHHQGDQTERAYARSDLLEKRRALMDRWAVYCTGGTASNVVQLHG